MLNQLGNEFFTKRKQHNRFNSPCTHEIKPSVNLPHLKIEFNTNKIYQNNIKVLNLNTTFLIQKNNISNFKWRQGTRTLCLTCSFDSLIFRF